MSFTKNTIKNICQKCGKEFRPVFYLGKKRIRRDKRRYCFECLPYQPLSEKNNQLYRSITNGKNTLDGKRQCVICFDFKEFSEFSPCNRKGNHLNSYCKSCAAKKRKTTRQRFKEKCVEYKGGKCVKCGYDKCVAALEFHHRDSQQKDFQVSRQNRPFNEIITAELDKCDCLCSNCHKEVHYLIERDEENGREERCED